MTISTKMLFLFIITFGITSCSDKIIVEYNDIIEQIPIRSILDYGAKNDGSTDCSEAFTLALAAASQSKGAIITIPAGRYLLNSQVKATFSNRCQLTFQGAGVGITELIVNNRNGGFAIEFMNENCSFHLSDFKMTANHSRCGIGVDVRRPLTREYPISSFKAQNIELRLDPNDIATDKCFTQGFNIEGAYRPIFDNVIVAGPYGPNVDSTPESSLYYCDGGINITNSYAPYFKDCYMWSMKKAYCIGNLVDLGSKEIHFIRSFAVECLEGINIENNKRSPLQIDQGHYNCRIHGIKLSNCNQVQLQGCLMYNSSKSADLFNINYRDMHFIKCSNIKVIDNIYHFAGSTKRYGVEISGNCNDITLMRNKFTLNGGSIIVRKGANRITISDNNYDAVATPPVIE